MDVRRKNRICQKRKTIHMGIIVKYAVNIGQMKNFLEKVMQLIFANPVLV